MAWKTMVTELLWFLRGDTNIKFLLDYDCHIWDGDAYKNYTNNFLGYEDVPSKEEFIKEIKTNNEFANKWGELGPIYGEQWRSWRVGKGIETTLKTEDGETLYEAGSVYIDQITNLVNELKTNPDSRRMMVSAWNVGELDQMVLPPCHYGFQVYTRELSTEEQVKAYEKMGYTKNLDPLDYAPKRAISLMWNQRSVDTFLGLPFNIASYGLLLEIIAREVNMVPDELIGNLGDVHLYSNHIEQAKEQMYRRPYDLPKVQITERDWYLHPLVKLKSEERMFQQKIRSYRPECFELIGYESHPKIKAPLSN
jgi:thymidylate synthase